MTEHGNRLEYSESNKYRVIQKSFGKKLNLNFTCKDFQIFGTKEHHISYSRKEIKQMVYLFDLHKWRFFVKSKNQDLEVGISVFFMFK